MYLLKPSFTRNNLIGEGEFWEEQSLRGKKCPDLKTLKKCTSLQEDLLGSIFYTGFSKTELHVSIITDLKKK